MSKKGFLDSIEVESPCFQSWDEMNGNEQVRFCGHCAKNVINLSAITRKQAKKFVAQSDGGICVKYIRRPDGRIQTLKNTLHQITRQTAIAAGILGTSLSVSIAAYAQGEINSSKDSREKTETGVIAKEKTFELVKTKTATISGTVTDPTGAVIPATTVSLTNDKTNESRTIKSDEEGFYEFKNVSAGIYSLKSEAAYFKAHLATNIIVNEAEELKQNISLEINGQTVTVGFLIVADYEHALSTAVSNNDLEMVKSLISNGENVNAKDKNYNKMTALFVAVENGSLEIAEALLNAGAKVNVRDNEKRTPLMSLDSDATPELINLLLRHGAKTSAIDKLGNTILHQAAQYDNAEVMKVLLYNSANVDAQNKEGRTALMNAVEEGNFENVKILLEFGADANLQDANGESTLSLASEEKILEILKAYGAIK